MNKRTVLVTGGGGFIGSHLCERLLAEGMDVICLDNFFTGSKNNIRHLLANPSFELIRVMNTPKSFSGPVNLGNPQEFTVRQLAEKVLELTGSKSKLIFKELPQDDPVKRKPDISLARKVLKWKPEITVDEGLTWTIAYFSDLIRNKNK